MTDPAGLLIVIRIHPCIETDGQQICRLQGARDHRYADITYRRAFSPWEHGSGSRADRPHHYAGRALARSSS